MKRWVGFVLFLVVTGSVFAEFRIWRDKKGNSVEAEFVTATATQVVIKDRQGKQYKFAPSKLCADDQKYLRTAFPPRMEIEFKKSQDRRKEDYWSYSHVSMSGEMKVTKKEQKPYDKKLKAVLMMIGESQRTGDLIVLDRVENTFDFKSSREFSLEGGVFRMYEDRYDNSTGVKYKGYLAVVLDDKDKVVDVKSSRKDFEEKVTVLMGYKNKERFTKSFKKSPDTGSYTSGSVLYY